MHKYATRRPSRRGYEYFRTTVLLRRKTDWSILHQIIKSVNARCRTIATAFVGHQPRKSIHSFLYNGPLVLAQGASLDAAIYVNWRYDGG